MDKKVDLKLIRAALSTEKTASDQAECEHPPHFPGGKCSQEQLAKALEQQAAVQRDYLAKQEAHHYAAQMAQRATVPIQLYTSKELNAFVAGAILGSFVVILTCGVLLFLKVV